MKKRFLLFALVLILVMPLTAFATGEAEAQLPHVIDDYGLLNAKAAAELERLAAAYSADHGCSFYILILEDYRDYGSDTFQAARNIYETKHLGWGNEKVGSMLMLSMDGRDYELLFHGDETDTVFTEYGRDLLEDSFLEYFREDDFYGGFRAYLDGCDKYYTAAENGKPIDREKQFTVLFFLPGLIAAAVVGGVLYAPMNSTGLKRNANAYIEPGSQRLTRNMDMFVNRTVHRTRRETENNSSHGSSHRSGSYSGRSGKF